MVSEAQTATTGSVNVQDFIDAHPMSSLQWWACGLCFLVVALDGFDTAALGFVAPALRSEWALSPAQLNPALVAALVGSMLGAFVAGPLGDRYGRKRVLAGAVIAFGALGLAVTTAASVHALTVWRFLAGLGLGGAMPNAITLVSEYCPARRRALLVTTMYCGFTLGSALGGVVAAHMLPTYGWRGVLFLGGLLPLLVAPLLIFGLSESIRFLTSRGAPGERIARVLMRIAPLPPGTRRFHLPTTEAEAATTSPIRQIFTAPWRPGTLALCCSFFMSLLIVYLLSNWLPILIRDSGRSQVQAAWIVTAFQFGGTAGAVAIGWGMDHWSPSYLLSGAYALGAVFLIGIGQSYASLGGLLICIFGVGVCVSGTQVGASALAAAFFPDASRTTGVSWALGIGRIGGIVGSLSGGGLLALGFGYTGIFSLLTLPALLAAFAMWRMSRYLRDARRMSQATLAGP